MAYSAGRRVVVTGLGVVAPNGIGKEAFWSSLLTRESGVAPITLFDASQHPCQIAGEVKGFELGQWVDLQKIKAKRISRQTQLALSASVLALRDAGLTVEPANFVGPLYVCFGISTAAIEVITHGYERLIEVGAKRVPTHSAQACQPYHSASVLAAYLGCPTRTQTIASACPAGLDAIGDACAKILSGATSVALAGGVDAPVNSLAFACMAQAGMIGPSTYAPEKASRPFDQGHTVGVISEGAGLLVLEELQHARARGAHIYASITGFSTSMDEHFDQPGCGYESAMRQAMANAGRHAEEIDYVSAHGPGHLVLDRRETSALRTVLGAHAYRIAVSSVKGVTGNPLAAAGGFQTVATALAIDRGMIPPTANCDVNDPECDLDYVAQGPRRTRVGTAMIDAHGLGSGNSALIMEAVNPP